MYLFPPPYRRGSTHMSNSGVESMISWNSDHSSLLPIPWEKKKTKLHLQVPDTRHEVQGRLGLLTDADAAGVQGHLHLHVPAEPFGAFPATPRTHHVELLRQEALVDGRDGGRGDGGSGRVGLAPRAAGRGGHRVRFWAVLLYVSRRRSQRRKKYIRIMQMGVKRLFGFSIEIKTKWRQVELSLFSCFIFCMTNKLYCPIKKKNYT